MQTFLPYPNFELSAEILDNKRLGKQRVEALQLLQGSWANHPAAKMWKGFHFALCNYGIAICCEWTSRGFKDSCEAQIREIKLNLADTGLPIWLGNELFHASHRSNLLRKDPRHYGRFGWTELPILPYVWPNT
jgi:hypothetical protein